MTFEEWWSSYFPNTPHDPDDETHYVIWKAWTAGQRDGSEKMRERAAVSYGFMDELHFRKGRHHVQGLLRALPLEETDE